MENKHKNSIRQQIFIALLTPHITGSKKHSEERATLFAVRVHVLVSITNL
jgi:hypothetical protein